MREMKDSGIPCIGEVAEEFRVLRLKNVAEILDQFRKPITADQRNQDADVLYDYYGASGVIDKIDGYTIDDHVMLIGEDGANLRMRNLPLMYEVNGKAWINNHAHILKPKENILFQYLFLTLEGLDINPYITGSAQPKLNQENLKNIWLPVPPINVQQAIVDSLDREYEKVDMLIANVQAQIEKLKVYKQSVITEIVTKGLDPSVAMKDSGVEWIGEIPEHWGTAKLQYCAQIRSGITLGKKYPKGTEMIERPYLRVANVQSGGVLLDNLKTVEVSVEDDLQYRLSAGEVLMTEGGDRDKLGRGCVWKGQIDPCLHQNHIFALQTNDLLDPQFLAYMTASDVGRVYFDITAIKTTNLACTNSSKVLAFRFPLPKMDEQIQLVAYLDEKCAQIDRLIAIKQEKIKKLEQYKRSLIYEYVTGKREVV